MEKVIVFAFMKGDETGEMLKIECKENEVERVIENHGLELFEVRSIDDPIFKAKF